MLNSRSSQGPTASRMPLSVQSERDRRGSSPVVRVRCSTGRRPGEHRCPMEGLHPDEVDERHLPSRLTQPSGHQPLHVQDPGHNFRSDHKLHPSHVRGAPTGLVDGNGNQGNARNRFHPSASRYCRDGNRSSFGTHCSSGGGYCSPCWRPS
jgi:hypothetical protein